MSSYQYRTSRCGDKTMVRLSYLHTGNSCIGKTTSLYNIGNPNCGGETVIRLSYLQNGNSYTTKKAFLYAITPEDSATTQKIRCSIIEIPKPRQVKMILLLRNITGTSAAVLTGTYQISVQSSNCSLETLRETRHNRMSMAEIIICVHDNELLKSLVWADL